MYVREQEDGREYPPMLCLREWSMVKVREPEQSEVAHSLLKKEIVNGSDDIIIFLSDSMVQ